MSQSVFILGRQPALSLAELESVYGAPAVTPIGLQAALVDISPDDIDFDQLGGSIKLCRVLNFIESTQWHDMEKYLIKTVPNHLQYLPEGKMQLGLSAYGLDANIKQLLASGLKLKKVIKAAGRSVRLIPNKTPALGSAQVIHNHLTGPLGWELVFIKDGKRTILAQTVQEQDIEAYGARDQQRPKRDARVGMLPPKLAQIIINLSQPTSGAKILDPFCGSGVILQEALLMGHDVIGSDLSPKMVDYAIANMEWLLSHYRNISGSFTVEAGDATLATWQPFDTVAAETYLGEPLKQLPPDPVLQRIANEVNDMHEKFLSNLAKQITSGTRLCLAVPAWKLPSGFKHLPLLDHLEKLGYNRVSFVHANNEDLVYHRESQIVARELVILVRN